MSDNFMRGPEMARELDKAFRLVVSAYRWGHVESKIAMIEHYETVRQQVLDRGAQIKRTPGGTHLVLLPGEAQWQASTASMHAACR